MATNTDERPTPRKPRRTNSVPSERFLTGTGMRQPSSRLLEAITWRTPPGAEGRDILQARLHSRRRSARLLPLRVPHIHNGQHDRARTKLFPYLALWHESKMRQTDRELTDCVLIGWLDRIISIPLTHKLIHDRNSGFPDERHRGLVREDPPYPRGKTGIRPYPRASLTYDSTSCGSSATPICASTCVGRSPERNARSTRATIFRFCCLGYEVAHDQAAFALCFACSASLVRRARNNARTAASSGFRFCTSPRNSLSAFDLSSSTRLPSM